MSLYNSIEKDVPLLVNESDSEEEVELTSVFLNNKFGTGCSQENIDRLNSGS